MLDLILSPIASKLWKTRRASSCGAREALAEVNVALS